MRIQEEISRIPVDVLLRAMRSVHDRLVECEQRNGRHLEDVTCGMMCCFFCSVLCLKTTDSFISEMLKYALPYKCNCIMISNILIFFNT